MIDASKLPPLHPVSVAAGEIAELQQRAEQAENALIDIRQCLEDGEQVGSSARQTLYAITEVIKTHFDAT